MDMLLGKKPKYSVESEWAVILDRPANEFSKKRAIDKLAEVFSLSLQEAKDLIENTPIILLDNLSFRLADKIKIYFSNSTVNCSLTNDTFAKRKCFRAIWPQQPNLAHLLGDIPPGPEWKIQEIGGSNPEDIIHSEPAPVEFTPTQSYIPPSNDEQQ